MTGLSSPQPTQRSFRKSFGAQTTQKIFPSRRSATVRVRWQAEHRAK
jgi:hypothetical protein